MNVSRCYIYKRDVTVNSLRYIHTGCQKCDILRLGCENSNTNIKLAGVMAKFIAQIIITGTQIVGRAFARAIKQEIEASQDAAKRMGNAKTRAERVANNKAGLSLDEAKQILNVGSLEKEEILKKYDHLFKVNEKANGGTFYIQSKIVRAKERLEMELMEPEGGKSKPVDDESSKKT